MPSQKVSQRQPSWANVKAKLEGLDRKGLVGLVHDLYEANTANRRFLQARLVPSTSAVEKYLRGPGFSDHYGSESAAVVIARRAYSLGLSPLRAR
jgi:hypothetical protein